MNTSSSVAEFSPEIGLLICCSRSHLDESHCRTLDRLLRCGLDWSKVIRAAERHAILPLLSSHLNRYSGLIPADVVDHLRSARQLNALRNTLLTNELCVLLERFQQHSLPAIMFKGPALSLTLYDHLLLRRFGDLDLLIHKSDLARTTTMLESNGYRLAISARQQRYFLKHRYHYSFIREDGKVVVEVHWAFTPRCWSCELEEETLWGQRSWVTYRGTMIPTLSPEHHLLVLCAHGAKERWARLQLVVDLSELIRRYPIDWQWVWAEAARIRRERVLLLGLALAQGLLAAELPARMKQRVANDDDVRCLVDILLRDFFSKHRWPLRGIHLHRYFFRVWHHPIDRYRYGREQLFGLPQRLMHLMTPSEADQIAWRLPTRLRFLYYVVRPFRLIYVYRNPRHMIVRLLRFFGLS
ncbi:nucleotidyltransferase family protein [Novipirellula sp.]|uniref:nucleotidyltransferase domain-containing protein n=1 Tax=Novipirellula sp. TaxID=2795430 RepID=UPI0035625A79